MIKNPKPAENFKEFSSSDDPSSSSSPPVNFPGSATDFTEDSSPHSTGETLQNQDEVMSVPSSMSINKTSRKMPGKTGGFRKLTVKFRGASKSNTSTVAPTDECYVNSAFDHEEAPEQLEIEEIGATPIQNGLGSNPDETQIPPNQISGGTIPHRKRAPRLQRKSTTLLSISTYVSETKQAYVSDTCFMRDKTSLIDLVLAYQPKPIEKIHDEEFRARQYRAATERALQKLGLKLEREEVDESQDGKTCFLKIHANWDFLARVAEQLGTRVYLKDTDLPPRKNRIESFLNCFGAGLNPLRLAQVKDREIPDCFRMRFDRKYLTCYEVRDKLELFPPRLRSRLVNHELQRLTLPKLTIPGGDQRKSIFNGITHIAAQKEGARKTGKDESPDPDVRHITLDWLLRQGYYDSVYALHDCDLNEPECGDLPSREKPMRQWLLENWGNFRMWRHFQPTTHIYDYFGAQLGLYFAWLGFYTRMLVFPALLSIVCLIWGLFKINNPVVQDMCSSRNYTGRIICRGCNSDACRYTTIGSYCSFARLAAVFDNGSTFLFSLTMSIWAVTFLELWKRYESSLALRWGLSEPEEAEQKLRAEYQQVVRHHVKIDKVTGEPVNAMKTRDAIKRNCVSLGTAAVLIVAVVGFVGSVIIYRAVGISFWHSGAAANFSRYFGGPQFVTSVSASLLNLLFITIMSLVYPKIAWRLTIYECPKTQEDFDRSYTYKVVAFQFINYYGTLFYLAFFKGKFNGIPYQYTKFQETCSPSGCLTDVTIQLFIIMTLKQVFQNIVETAIPKLKTWFKGRSVNKASEEEGNEFTRWEKDFILNQVENPVGFDDYLEMVIQYGFLTMFAPAFPIAAFFALLNNIFEIRIDAAKYLTEMRRPISDHVASITPWDTVLATFTRISVVVNAFIIAFTSETVDQLVHQYNPLDPVNEENHFLDFSMSKFNTSDLPDPDLAYDDVLNRTIVECYYRGVNFPPGHPNQYESRPDWVALLLARLAFVIVFEHLVFSIQILIENLIPDMSSETKIRKLREEHLINKTMEQAFLGDQDNIINPDPALPPEIDVEPEPPDPTNRERKNSIWGFLSNKLSMYRSQDKESDKELVPKEDETPSYVPDYGGKIPPRKHHEGNAPISKKLKAFMSV